MKTGLYFDPIFYEHKTGQHPEAAKRLFTLHDHLYQLNILSSLQVIPTKAASLENIELVHDHAYVAKFEAATLFGRRWLDFEECVISEKSFNVALHAAGAAIEAVKAVHQDLLDNAFCAVRPPGHHAEKAEANGFCFFNNVAIAAQYLTQKLGYKRVLIFDFDVHHGNGTQHFFEERSDVFYASVHQDPLTCFPGTGFATERGLGHGQGHTLNCPLPAHSKDSDYIHLMDHTLLPLFRELKPDFILLSAGFDAHENDPLANMDLSYTAFDHISLAMKKLAEETCSGKLVSILEGGYAPFTLAECVSKHLSILQEGKSSHAAGAVTRFFRHYFTSKVH